MSRRTTLTSCLRGEWMPCSSAPLARIGRRDYAPSVLVSVGDVRLFVDIDGAKLVPDGMTMRERPTIICLHGGPGFDHTPYKALYPSLRDIAQVVYYDHRANGRSESGPPERWTLDRWADDLRALCNALGIERPIVFGSSFGGFVALNYALRHPDHPAKLILASTTAHIHLERALAMFERLGGAKVRDVAERYFTVPTPEHLEQYLRICWPIYTQRPLPPEIQARVTMRPDVAEHFFRAEILTFDLRPRLGEIRCPVLQLAGELDPMVTIEDAEELAAALPAELLRLERFPRAGHLLAIEDPDAVLALIREFVLER
jgi:pimeloyl-ACP methyl ester carboxylesterase